MVAVVEVSLSSVRLKLSKTKRSALSLLKFLNNSEKVKFDDFSLETNGLGVLLMVIGGKVNNGLFLEIYN